MKCTTVYTLEMDDFDLALREINEQLSKKLKLKANTAGIIMCHPEFVLSGVAAHLAANLPFKIAGTTVASQATNVGHEAVGLSLFVMTADDVEFVVGATDSIAEDAHKPLETALKGLGVEDKGDFKAAFVFAPLILEIPGDDYVEAWEKCMPGLPIFGMLTSDDTPHFDEAKSIYGETASKTVMSFILLKGNVKPRFVMATLKESSTLPYRGEITRSKGPVVYEINGINAAEYMKSIGFADEDDPFGVYWHVTFEISQKTREDYDGVPILRSFAEVKFDEDGRGIFYGNVDEGSFFSMRDVNRETVCASTKEVAGQIAKLPDVNGIFVASCIIRMFAQSSCDAKEEFSIIKKAFGSIPFMAGYVSGEMCPTSVRDDFVTNRFHNCTIAFCVL